MPGSLEWVRPLHSIVATFGPETEEPEIVRVATSTASRRGNTTYGHRFMAPGPIKVRHFDDYVAKLEKAKVVLDPARRREIILNDAKNLAFAQGLELVEDEGLLNEVAGLVEWPVVLMGTFDEVVPEDSRRGDPRHHPQQPEMLRGARSEDRPARQPLHPDLQHRSGRRRQGDHRRQRARDPRAASDAKFFYETDLKIRLEERLPKFKDIVFHEKLGTQAERIERIARLAAELAPLVGADPEKAKTAALLCKTDLLTEMVGEFPEVQGMMGKYYALAQGEDAAVAPRSRITTSRQGPDDRVPTDPVSIAVALADKIDTLVGFWAIDEKPTGSKDPYALRRAALGVIRIVLDNALRLHLSKLIHDACGGHAGARTGSTVDVARDSHELAADLLFFFHDRLKVQLRDQGARHDLVDAVLAQQGEGQDDLLLIVRRVEALGKFLATDDGTSLLAGIQARDQHPAHRGEEGRHARITAGPTRISISSPRSASLPPRSMP